ncbi:MAG TPA: ATP-binding protein [Thermoanaerobaculia bacterium]|nr:ATP-binding protein [Thermoanaerobaculia bacterium]
MTNRHRFVLQSALAVALPVVAGAIWPRLESTDAIAVCVFLLAIGLAGRFLGLVPALVCTAASTLTLLFLEQHPTGPEIARLATFSVAALVILGVSHRKAIDARREMTANRLYGLFEGVVESIFFVGSTGRCVEVNPAAAELIGVSRQVLLGARIGELTVSPDPTIGAAFLTELDKERMLRGQMVVQRKDGKLREIEYAAVADILPGVHCIVARDVTERNETERSFSQLSRRLVELQDEERRRIARELHDTTGQDLAALRLNVSKILRISPPPLELVDETFALIDRAASEIRTLSYLLHPPMIGTAGLTATLRWYVRNLEERSGIAVRLDADEDLGPMTPDAATSLFRVIQEALTNIHRHSHSQSASVRLKHRDDAIELEVADEGRGLPPELIGNIDELGAFGLGLAGMKERIESLGGTLRIASGSGGTRLTATLPVTEPEDQTSSDGEFGASRFRRG